MNDGTIPPPDPWAAATYEGNEREQLLRCAKWSFTKKVRWLEQAHRLSMKLEQARIARRNADASNSDMSPPIAPPSDYKE